MDGMWCYLRESVGMIGQGYTWFCRSCGKCEGEERGGHDATALIQSGISMNVNYIVGLDRKGENDAVYYGCDNRAFSEFVAEFSFQDAFGSFSDISILAPHLKTATVNLSTGYYNAHRNHELIDREVMAINTERVIEMVMTPTEHYPYRTKPTKHPKFARGQIPVCPRADRLQRWQYRQKTPDAPTGRF